jgi:phosphoribosylaminoimidazolecarboxamide formyltransferase/IMP cyclohydrolase
MKNRVTEVSNLIRVRRVLISVSDKTGLLDLVKGLEKLIPGVELYSTGGTYKEIARYLQSTASGKSSLILREVSEYTGQPETQGGLVKTLDFKIYLGLLTEEHNDSHKADLERTGAHFFDLVVVNLYPFEDTVKATNSTLEDARGNIDIGGPTMIRAAAKNFLRVGVVTDPQDYQSLLKTLEQRNGTLDLETRLELAKKAFTRIAAYDVAIAEYLVEKTKEDLHIYNEKGATLG